MQRHRPTRPRSRRTIAAVAMLSTLIVGCGGSDGDAGGGESREPTERSADQVRSSPPTATTEPTAAARTLSIATTPGWESDLEPILAALNGIDGGSTFQLDVPWTDANAGEDVEQRILAAVASGEIDAGYLGVRALSAVDAPGFDVLVAPGLIDSYELQEAVLASEVPGRLLPALDALGVAGMALVPGPMRYPIGVAGLFVGPGDFAGATFHTFPAGINALAAEALGADHSQLWGGERDDAIDAGAIDVTENSLLWMRNNGRGSHVTLGPLWPAMGVFVVNAGLLSGMPAAQVEAMRSAIVDGSPSAADLLAADSELAAELCAAGKQVVRPSAEDGASMVAALQPVYEAVAADQVAGAVLDEIEAIKATLVPSTLSVADDCVAAAGVVAAGTDDPSVLNGSYQLEWTVEELMSELDAPEGDARGNAGAFVLSFEDGVFDMVWQNFPDDPCGGTYAVSGDRVQLVASTDPAEWTCGGESLGDLVVDAAWSLESDQLVLSDFELSPQPDITWWNAGFLSKPLTRV